jgi:hypothetical protein
VCLDIRIVHFSRGTLDEAWRIYGELFARKHAPHLADEQGEWISVQNRVATREQIVASYDERSFRFLTEEIQARLSSP